ISENLSELRDVYKNKINQSKFRYNPLAGDFSFASGSVYFWQALLETESLRSNWINNVIRSKLFRIIFLASVWAKIGHKDSSKERKDMFAEIVKNNEIRLSLVHIVSKLYQVFSSIYAVVFLISYRIPRKIYRLLFSKEVRYAANHSEKRNSDLLSASEDVYKIVKSKNLL
ncbi:MAG: hypothetical protein WD512_19435, partial [Candidatus Paceibacterota bacterium]